MNTGEGTWNTKWRANLPTSLVRSSKSTPCNWPVNTSCPTDRARLNPVPHRNEGKRCPKCGETKTGDLFYRNRSARDGKSHWCKLCTNSANRAWAAANISLVRALRRKSAARHADKERERSRIKYERDKDK